MDPIDRLEDCLGDASLSREAVLQQACLTTREAVPRANLVSFWRFDSSLSSITSLINYNSITQEFGSNWVLESKSYGPYFNSILENELVVAPNAREMHATRCFNSSYFEPNDIFSLLDFILHKNYRPVGVLCCESQGIQVEWQEEDIENLRIIATMMSYYFDV